MDSTLASPRTCPRIGDHLSQKTKEELRAAAGKILRILAVVLMLTGGVSASVAAAQKVDFDIEAQAMGQALRSFADQTDLQILYSQELVRDLECVGVMGRYAPETALTMLLDGSGLAYDYADEETLVIVKEDTAAEEGSGSSGHQSEVEANKADSDEEPASGDEKTKVEDDEGTFRGEIVVTVNRREENPMDVPSSLTAWEATVIEEHDINDITELIALTPGAHTERRGQQGDRQQFIIRGLFQGGGNATVGVFIDDVAVTVGKGGQEPTLRLFDMERVEILRGPQGTLYGAATVGGAVKYVSKKPNLTRFEGQARFEAASLAGGEHDAALDVAVSVPIVQDKLAFRLSGSHVDGGGFIDMPNVGTGPIEDSNTRNFTSLRGALRWQPVERLILDLVGVYDVREHHGLYNSAVSAGCCWIDDTEWPMNRLNESEFKMLSFNLSYDLGWAELVSLTSYFDSLNVDHKPSRPQWGVPYFSVLSYIWPGEAFSQEIRLVSTNGGRLTWTAGAYYQDSKNDSSYSVKIPELEDYEYWNGTTSISREQISLYGEVGYWISDRWEATAGLRYFTENARTRILSITEGEVAEDVDAEETFSTPAPRFILSYRPSERVNVYASASKGFRAGGINISNYPSVPASYDPDWLWAYEVGVKAATSRLAVTAALFYNDWQDMQYYFYDNDLWEGYMTNGPSAHSAGIELQLDTQVTRGLRLTFTGSFLESVWDEDFDSGIEYFEAGDRLQYVPDWQLGLLLAYDTPLTAKSVLSIRVDGAYGGDTQWASDDPIHDSTERWNAKIGIVWPTWELGVFVRNITNDVCNIPEGYQHQSVRTYNSPRAVGLELVTKF